MDLIEGAATLEGSREQRSAAASGNLAWLKNLALIAMAFDHIAFAFLSTTLPDAAVRASLWRLPGRLSIPLFAFLVAYSFSNYTSAKGKFVLRLWGFALISEPIYFLYFGEWGNAMMPLALGATWLLCDGQARRGWERARNAALVVALGAVLCVVSGSPAVLTVTLLVWCFAEYDKAARIAWVPAIALLIILSNNIGAGEMAMTAVTLGLIKGATSGVVELAPVRANKWFAYAFYPGHLVILYAVVHGLP